MIWGYTKMGEHQNKASPFGQSSHWWAIDKTSGEMLSNDVRRALFFWLKSLLLYTVHRVHTYHLPSSAFWCWSLWSIDKQVTWIFICLKKMCGFAFLSASDHHQSLTNESRQSFTFKSINLNIACQTIFRANITIYRFIHPLLLLKYLHVHIIIGTDHVYKWSLLSELY